MIECVYGCTRDQLLIKIEHLYTYQNIVEAFLQAYWLYKHSTVSVVS